MILYQNELLKLDFQPSQRLLEITWPSFEGRSKEESKLIITRVLNAINDYEVNYLLIDAKATNLGIEISQFHDLASFFITELPKTSVKRVARISTYDQNREQLVNHLASGQPMDIDYSNFTNKTEALAWLLPEQII